MKEKFIMADSGNLPIPIIEVLKMIERKNLENEEGRFIFKIMGDEYVIKGQDDPAYMGQVVSYLESITDSITSANPKLSKCQVAVLAGLKIADEFHKLRQEYQYLDQLLKEAR
jgi:cell division protein ZapA